MAVGTRASEDTVFLKQTHFRLCIHVYIRVWVCAEYSAYAGQKGEAYPLELELQALVSCYR